MNDNEATRIAHAMNAARPDWPIKQLETLLGDLRISHRPRRDVFVAMAWVASEADTTSPYRVLESGPWWKAAGFDGGEMTISHTGKTVGADADPRHVCGICSLLRSDCESRSATNGHRFIPRSECLPAIEPQALGIRGRCLAGPPDAPCRLITGHDGQHDCDQIAAATATTTDEGTDMSTEDQRKVSS